MLSLGCLVATLLAFIVIEFYVRRSQYPPGPFPIPLLGNLPSFVARYYFSGHGPADVMLTWKRSHGNVFTVWFGPLALVAVTDYDVAVQTYVKEGDVHAKRFEVSLFTLLREGYGLVLSNGTRWQEQRRFALRIFKDFGYGKNLMQERILQEYQVRMNELNKEFEGNEGKLTFNPEPNLEYALREFNIVDFALINEFTKKLPILGRRFKKIKKIQEKPVQFILKQIEKRKADIASGVHILQEGVPQDFLDAYLLEMRRREKMGDMGEFSEKQVSFAILDAWQAGMETTIATISWGFAYLVNHVGIQQKMREELLRVVGKNATVEMGHKLDLPYTSAVVTETHRLSQILNINLWREAGRDCKIGGHPVKKGTANAVMIAVIAKDETVFNQPEKFKPERFIEDKTLEQKVVPFSLGKRQCLGEGLARAEVFLILANIVKDYRLTDEDGTVDWQHGSDFGFLKMPYAANITFEKL
ncbi:hypothetical protein L596_029866 [Steinernema carpocapsae]|uniref:Cytochrome P450 n=1 Tax=Steinernema carpocapsae TaxID=34508 RepID=A0A4U5LR27_STECR|nr:hypothetical protein L596_029866 [Steinernema carpocapsae]